MNDRLFLFGDYEGVRHSRGIPRSEFVVSNAVRAGTIRHLATGATTTVEFNPVIQKSVGLYHVSNGPAVNANVGQYYWEANQATTEAGEYLDGFARITATQAPPRQIQFGLKAIW